MHDMQARLLCGIFVMDLGRVEDFPSRAGRTDG